jgi:hypothetical protein
LNAGDIGDIAMIDNIYVNESFPQIITGFLRLVRRGRGCLTLGDPLLSANVPQDIT